MLKLDNVTFAYGRGFQLRAVSLTVNPGDFIMLIGPNGSGKSTLLQLASGWLSPASGTVTLNGIGVQRLSGRRRARKIGVVRQQPPPALGITAEELVMLGREPHLAALGGPGAADRAAVEAELRRMELTELRQRAVAELSGGERQRVQIAAALAGDPECLLLDEPTSAQDPRYRRLILKALRERRERCGILMVTHDLELAAAAPLLGLMAQGSLLAFGPPETVLTAPLLERAYRTAVRIERRADGTPAVLFPDDPGPDLPER